MIESTILFFIGKAVAELVAQKVVGIEINLDFAWSVAQKVRDGYAQYKEKQRQADVQALAQATDAEVQGAAKQIADQVGAGLSQAQRQQVETYLRQVPSLLRKSLRRSSDRTGRTVPPEMTFVRPEDFLGLLPQRLPRFKPGDRPLPGVDWELEEMLGVGGFGEVWKARNPHFANFPAVALKFCLDPDAKERLLKHEATILSHVMQQGKHEGIVALQHTYLNADPPCLEYQYVAGGNLADWIKERQSSRGGVSAEKATKIVLNLAEIIAFAHRIEPPIVHRDLKPANILIQLQPNGKTILKVADFGIGGLAVKHAIACTRRSTRREDMLASAVQGAYTPLYASPQQMHGDPPDPRDDVYSLGVIWYQLLTGDVTTGIPSEWQEEVEGRNLGKDLISLLASCITSNAEKRLANAVILAALLKRITSHTPGPILPPSTSPAILRSTSPERPVAVKHAPSSRVAYSTPRPKSRPTEAPAEQKSAKRLREMLLQDLDNVELRQRYLAVRTSEQRALDQLRWPITWYLAGGAIPLAMLGLVVQGVEGLVGAGLGAFLGVLAWGMGKMNPTRWQQACSELGPLPDDAPSDLISARHRFLGVDEKNRSKVDIVRSLLIRIISLAVTGTFLITFFVAVVIYIGLLASPVQHPHLGSQQGRPSERPAQPGISEANPVVVLDTSFGPIKVELFKDKAPITVKNFLSYVDDKFYDGTIFHRAIPNFMIQGGGFEPGMNQKKTNDPIKNESTNGLSNLRGTIAMARTSVPDSATDQFFINVRDNLMLDKDHAQDGVGYAVFGKVLDGMGVVDKIRSVRTGRKGGHGDVPVEDVMIVTVRRESK